MLILHDYKELNLGKKVLNQQISKQEKKAGDHVWGGIDYNQDYSNVNISLQED